MPSNKPVTRAGLQRAIAVNALTKPLNVAIPAVVVVAGIAIGAWWLLVVALIAYLGLAATTFFDENEAKRVGDRAYGRERADKAPRLETKQLAPEIRAEVEAARAEQARIGKTIAGSDLPFAEVGTEVEGLVRSMEATARRAQLVREYLATQDPYDVERRLAVAQSSETAKALRDQLAVLEQLTRQLRRFHDEMEQVNAALAAIHGKLVGAAVVSQESADAELAGDVRDLRERVDAVTSGITEAYAQTQP